jgi:hypothetical protein
VQHVVEHLDFKGELLTKRVIALSLPSNPPVVSGFFPTQWKEDFAGNGGMSHEDMTRVAFEDRAYLLLPKHHDDLEQDARCMYGNSEGKHRRRR